MSDTEKRLDELAWMRANANGKPQDRQPRYSAYHESILLDFQRQIEDLKVLVDELREYLITSEKKRKRK